MPNSDQKPEIPKLYNCQTPRCPNSYECVVLWVGDSKAQYFCTACFCAFFAAVVRGLAEQADQLAASQDVEPLAQNAPTG